MRTYANRLGTLFFESGNLPWLLVLLVMVIGLTAFVLWAAWQSDARREEPAWDAKRWEAEQNEAKEALKKKYRHAPPSAKTAYNALKKLEALTEIGVNYVNYGQAVGSAWGDVKLFVESPESNKYSEVRQPMMECIQAHKRALESWKTSIDQHSKPSPQGDWHKASASLKLVADLLNQ